MTTVNPYLTFDGNCEEAFNFYRSVFGGDFPYVGKFKDMPENPDFPVAESEKERVMHISLPISKETVLMGSDTSGAFGKTTSVGDNILLSVNTDSVEEVTRIYTQLSEGGKVNMPLNKTFWGAYFGMITDKFGIHWQLNCELPEHKEYEQENRKDGKSV